MCGFAHSMLVTAPLSVTGLFASNSAANEWCAETGWAAASRPAARIPGSRRFIETSVRAPLYTRALPTRKEFRGYYTAQEAVMRIGAVIVAGVLLSGSVAGQGRVSR